jgi:DNA polymerase III alpha subunit
MKSDYYSNPIFQDADIFELLYKGDLDSLGNIIADASTDVEKLKELSDIKLVLSNQIPNSVDIKEFDTACQSNWFIPESYKNFDIVDYIKSLCSHPSEIARVEEELKEFEARNMIELLRVLKYVVDTLRENNTIWGVGRGSSVASYVLFLLGVHKIDSMKYNLDWREFLR